MHTNLGPSPWAMVGTCRCACRKVSTTSACAALGLSAPRHAFQVGQLVQVRGNDGRYDRLARVTDLEAGARGVLEYRCRLVADAPELPDPRRPSAVSP